MILTATDRALVPIHNTTTRNARQNNWSMNHKLDDKGTMTEYNTR